MIRIVVVMAAVLSLPLSAGAQGRSGDVPSDARLKIPTWETLVAPHPNRPDAIGGSNAIETAKANRGSLPPVVQTRHRSIGHRIIGGAAGAVAGLFAGGYLGAKIEGNGCNCDDPGLKGALIGAPIGMVSGAILGALFF